jgi:hypothetical protein
MSMCENKQKIDDVTMDYTQIVYYTTLEGITYKNSFVFLQYNNLPY